MKRTFTYLLLLVLLVCGKQAYNLLISNESIRSNPTGALSDIADEVIAIPLQDSGTHSIREAKYILKREITYSLSAMRRFTVSIARENLSVASPIRMTYG
mgnify:CR=1 FL=1